jgi:membrane-associated phospholipid phosphatase
VTLKYDFRLVSGYLIRSCKELPVRFWLIWVLFFVISAVAIVPFEPDILKYLQAYQPSFLKGIAGFLAQVGKFQYFNLMGTAVLILLAYGRNDRWIRRVAISFFIASLLSAIVAQSIKPLVGRPRPSVCKHEKVSRLAIAGPNQKRGYNSFPSGHTATTAAGAAVIAIAFPRWIVPCVILVMSMGWSRMFTNSHFPLDVLHGAGIGILSAYVSTRWLVKRRRAPWRISYSMRSQPILREGEAFSLNSSS